MQKATFNIQKNGHLPISQYRQYCYRLYRGNVNGFKLLIDTDPPHYFDNMPNKNLFAACGVMEYTRDQANLTAPISILNFCLDFSEN